MQNMCSNEKKARELAADRDALYKRLLYAKALLRPDFKQMFTKNKFSFQYKCLFSDDDVLVLQWRLRPNPERPVSFINSQTSCGAVALYNNIYALGEHINALPEDAKW